MKSASLEAALDREHDICIERRFSGTKHWDRQEGID